MKVKAPKWPLIPFLVCIALCVGLSLLLSSRAFAVGSTADAPSCTEAAPTSGVAVEIAPPTGYASKSAEVAFTITDTTGNGFDSVKIKLGLDGAWQDVTNTLEQWESRYTGRVTITDNCAVTVRVTGHDGKIYEKMCYINCFEHGSQIFLTNVVQGGSDAVQAPSNTPSGGGKPDSTGTSANKPVGGGTAAPSPTPSASASNDPDSQPDTTPRNPTALTPDGQGTVMNDVTDDDGKEFFTIKTSSENIFYLIIDKQRDSENVYFLNTVTESDLMALAEKEDSSTSAVPDLAPVCVCKDKCEAGAVNTACPVCVLSMTDCAGTAPAPAEPVEQPKESGGSGSIAIILLAMLAVGGVGWYVKIYKPKHDMADAEDFDDLTGGEEQMVNEDGEPEVQTQHEPGDPDYHGYDGDEPDYPDGYGDEL